MIKLKLLKTISYRIVSSFATFLIAYGISHQASVSALVSVSELFIKPAIYYLHEMIWLNTERKKIF